MTEKRALVTGGSTGIGVAICKALLAQGYEVVALSRREAGLHFGGVSRVITDLGVLGFDGLDKSMRLEAVHPGVTTAEVQEATSFPLHVDGDVPTTREPSDAELELLTRIDPKRIRDKEVPS